MKIFSFHCCIIFFLVCASSAEAQLIEIGQASATPLKWAPDGTTIAFSRGQTLLFSDTLGNTMEIASFDMPIHKMEWISDEEIILDFIEYFNRSKHNRLVKYDRISSKLTILEEYTSTPYTQSLPESYGRIEKTIEGRVYYYKHTVNRTGAKSPQPIVVLESSYAPPDSKSNNTFLYWGDDGLYIHDIEQDTSFKIAPKPYMNLFFPPLLSPDNSFYVQGGYIYNFADSTYIVLDTMFTEYPPGTGATSFLYPSINSNSDEILFNVIFHDGDNYEVFRIGIYNLSSGTLTILDPIIGIEGCRVPSFSPDGNKIAFWAAGNAYIYYWRK